MHACAAVGATLGGGAAKRAVRGEGGGGGRWLAGDATEAGVKVDSHRRAYVYGAVRARRVARDGYSALSNSTIFPFFFFVYRFFFSFFNLATFDIVPELVLPLKDTNVRGDNSPSNVTRGKFFSDQVCETRKKEDVCL